MATAAASRAAHLHRVQLKLVDLGRHVLEDLGVEDLGELLVQRVGLAVLQVPGLRVRLQFAADVTPG